MARNRTIDRAINPHGKGARIATVVVMVIGALVLLWVVSPTERKRRSAMGDLELGSDTAQVVELLGPPVRCPGNALEAIRPGFPTDWPPPAVENALTRLQQETAQRWVYGINPRRRTPCATTTAHSEIGIDARGRVLWFIALTGKTNITVPDEYSPSGG